MFVNPTTTTMFIVNRLDKMTLEKICSINKKKGNVLLFIIKGHNEKITPTDVDAMDFARKRGVIGKVLYEGEFSAAFGRGEWH